MKRLIGLLALSLMLPLVGCASKKVTPLEVGTKVTLKGIENQYGEPFKNQDSMQALMFVEGMSAKEVLQSALDRVDTSCLGEGKLVYLADISGMPSLISNMVAVPKMRTYDYPIWLDREGDISATLPSEEDHVSLLSINKQVVTAASFYANSDTLSQELIDECGIER
mgnify:CR=1 FL=1